MCLIFNFFSFLKCFCEGVVVRAYTIFTKRTILHLQILLHERPIVAIREIKVGKWIDFQFQGQSAYNNLANYPLV